MNSYQLISKLRKVRTDTYLTTASQALYHELVAICNEMKWKDIFFVRSSVLCANLDMSDNTLRKSRNNLAESGLIYFETSKDKRIGCYYSFARKLSNDIVSPAVSSAISYSKNAGDIADDGIDNDEGHFVESSSLSPSISSSEIADDTKGTSAASSSKIADEMQIPPIIDINKTINKESIHTCPCEVPPPKNKGSRKKEGDAKPLVFPFSSDRFMSTWGTLVNTPKWKKKLNLALQLSLNKLGQFEEEFAIRQMERAIESDWTGVVFTGTEKDYQEWLNLKNGNNRKPCTSKQEANAYAFNVLNQHRQAIEGGMPNKMEKPF